MPADGLQPEVRNCIVPARPLRWVLIHYHIFKNAGSTIEYVLQRSFGDQFVTLHGPGPDAILGASDVLAFLEHNPEVMAVSSHHLKFPRPASPDFVIFDLCFLRDPLQRLWSMYRYMRRVEAYDELGQMAKTSDIRTFAQILIRDHPQLINDAQVNLLSLGGVYTRPPTETDLRVALDVLRQIAVPGVVDIFDRSLVAAEYFLRPAFPRLQFQYVKQNVTPNDGDASVRLELREELGETLYAQLLKLNRLDYELLARAREEVERRCDMVPDREERHADFNRRCEHLRTVHEALAQTSNEIRT